MIRTALSALALVTGQVVARGDLSALVDYQTFELESDVSNMIWCGAQDEIVLVLTGDGNILRSRDRGSNWKRLRTLMAQKG